MDGFGGTAILGNLQVENDGMVCEIRQNWTMMNYGLLWIATRTTMDSMTYILH